MAQRISHNLTANIANIEKEALMPSRSNKRLWIFMLMIAGMGLCGAISIAQAQTDTATESINSLTEVVIAGDVTQVRRLIGIGAEVNTTNGRNFVTALHVASHNGHTEIVKLLLEAGAKVNVQTRRYARLISPKLSQYPFTTSVESDVRLDLEDRVETIYEYTPLMLASQNGSTETVKLLLENGAKVNVETRNGTTALHVASQNGHTEIVKLLFEAGAKVNVAIKNISIMVFVSTFRIYDKEIIDQQELGWESTPLILALRNGHLEAVKLLIDAGAKVNAKTSYGFTSLILASEKGYTEIVKLLLDAGAKVDTALITSSVYEKRRREKISIYDRTFDRTFNRKNRNVEYNLYNYLNIMGKSTPLILASQKDYVEIVKLLLSAGAKVNKKNSYNSTALILASKNNHVEIVKRLLDAGANVNQTDKDDATALIFASNNGSTGVVKLLLDAGAKTDTRVKTEGERYTALDLANSQGHTEIVKLLKEYEAKD